MIEQPLEMLELYGDSCVNKRDNSSINIFRENGLSSGPAETFYMIRRLYVGYAVSQ